MTENTNTPFDKRCEILADLWMNYRDDENFKEFIEYCDLALPLAYAIHGEIITVEVGNTQPNDFIEEAWNILVAGFRKEDTGFNSLDEIMEE